MAEAYLRPPVPERRTTYLDRDIRPAGVLILGGKYECASIDEVFCKKLGYEKAELVGKSLIDLAYPAEQEKCKRLLIQAAQNKEAAYNAEVRFVCKNGETVRTKLTVTRGGDHYANSGEVFVTVEDFIGSPGRKTSSSAKRLAQIQASARILMHELRNQMHSISLIAHTLEQETARRGLVKDDSLVVLNQDLTRRLADLRILLQDSKRFGETVKLKLQPTDLAKFVTTMVGSEQACHIAAGRIRIDADLARDVPLIELDRHRFKQVWLNLFKNAVEAMPSGGTITVRLYRSDAHVCLEIEDTGTGVPEGIDVFKPFITTKPQGTGLGLGIVREIVSAHGGVVLYQSTPHTGACFTISLPLAVASRSDC
jgi:PAS domain S-box-containing protein